MKQVFILSIVFALMLVVGCEEKGNSTETTTVKTTAECPTCEKQMPEDAYCSECNAVATLETEPVHCDKCDVDFAPGTYCAQCNRFMLNAKVHCGNCQDKVAKGHYCTTEMLFKGLPDVAYCQEHTKPYAKSSSCTDCSKQAAGTGI